MKTGSPGRHPPANPRDQMTASSLVGDQDSEAIDPQPGIDAASGTVSGADIWMEAWR